MYIYISVSYIYGHPLMNDIFVKCAQLITVHAVFSLLRHNADRKKQKQKKK